jgi:hypothetical protein
MKFLRRFAAITALSALAAVCIVPGSQAALKSWGEECKAEHTPIGPPHDDPKKMCCVDKWHQCEKNCERNFVDEGAISLCRQACSREHAKCMKDVERALLPGSTRPNQSQVGKSYESRICCKTGRRHGWAMPQDCRRQGGSTVHGRFCNIPAARKNPAAGRTKSGESRVCCRKGRNHEWASSRQCRTGRGRAVDGKYCRQSQRLRARRSGGLKVCCKYRSGGRDYCSTQDASKCIEGRGTVTVDSCCEKRRVLERRQRAN